MVPTIIGSFKRFLRCSLRFSFILVDILQLTPSIMRYRSTYNLTVQKISAVIRD